MSFEQARQFAGVRSGTVAIIGGPGVFAMFMDHYDTFWLSQAGRVKLPGGEPCFPGVGPRSPQGPSGLISEVAAVDRREPASEDCLRLNVWTPSLGTGRRPVMVWLHGGGYSQASGSFIIYNGANLARRREVVVVTLNHRLN